MWHQFAIAVDHMATGDRVHGTDNQLQWNVRCLESTYPSFAMLDAFLGMVG